MNIAYIIHAYKLPSQLGRLVNKLNSKNSFFFVHVDKNVDLNTFAKKINLPAGNIQFVKREKSYWGHINTVKAVLHGMKEAYNHPVKFDVFQLLSGQCYPVKSQSQIEKVFENHPDKSFIEYFPINSQLPPHWLDRIEKYHIQYRNRKIVYPFTTKRKPLEEKIIGLYGNLFLRSPREPYNKMSPYGGAFYFSLSREAVKYVLDFLASNDRYLKSHRYTLIPEEIFFQTLLLNSKKDRIIENLVNKSLTFVRWDNGPNPLVLTSDDFDRISETDLLFARKFDCTVDQTILNQIDLLHTN